jgi:hypothetical protein
MPRSHRAKDSRLARVIAFLPTNLAHEIAGHRAQTFRAEAAPVRFAIVR